MNFRHGLLFAALLAGCSPSSINAAADFDARVGVDGGAVDHTTTNDTATTERADSSTSSDSSVADVAAVDVPPVVDVPQPDVAPATDLPTVLDVVPVVDVPSAVDVPVAIDVPMTTDVSTPADAGSCPAGAVLVPAGTFTMGTTMGVDPRTVVDEQPVHAVQLSAFCMDVTPVTVAEYRACTAPGCTAPGVTGSCNWLTGRDNHPVNCVHWNHARAYCQSRGGDLPTEAQWEYAARGTDGRWYPWGNTPPEAQLCWSGAGARSGTCPVRLFPSGDSPFGLSDMAGNVFTWILDWYGPYSGSDSAVSNPTGPGSGTMRVSRGGSWFHGSPDYVRAAFRYARAPTDQVGDVGIRCAYRPH
jgi:formylglycine-generating enzyme required for sulfatase activity